jgi:hypothetical protein
VARDPEIELANDAGLGVRLEGLAFGGLGVKGAVVAELVKSWGVDGSPDRSAKELVATSYLLALDSSLGIIKLLVLPTYPVRSYRGSSFAATWPAKRPRPATSAGINEKFIIL